MKTIQIIPSKYGGLDGWVDGKLRYDSKTNEIEIGRLPRNWRIENFSAAIIKVKIKNDFETLMAIGTSGTVESISPSLKYTLISSFHTIASFVSSHWKEGLYITGSISGILSALKSFGFLNYYQK